MFAKALYCRRNGILSALFLILFDFPLHLNNQNFSNYCYKEDHTLIISFLYLINYLHKYCVYIYMYQHMYSTGVDLLHQFLIFFFKKCYYFCTMIFINNLHNTCTVQQSNNPVSCSDLCAIFSHIYFVQIHHGDFANTRKDLLLVDTLFCRKQKHSSYLQFIMFKVY